MREAEKVEEKPEVENGQYLTTKYVPWGHKALGETTSQPRWMSQFRDDSADLLSIDALLLLLSKKYSGQLIFTVNVKGLVGRTVPRVQILTLYLSIIREWDH